MRKEEQDKIERKVFGELRDELIEEYRKILERDIPIWELPENDYDLIKEYKSDFEKWIEEVGV